MLCLGSCRLSAFKDVNVSTQITDTITYTHSTRDTLQIIKWLAGDLNIPLSDTKYIFHRAMWGNKEIGLTPDLKSLFNQTKCFIIELCSCHTYMVNDYCCYPEIIANPYTMPRYKALQHIPSTIRDKVKKNIR